MGRNWPSGQRTSLTALVRGRSVAAAAALACAPVLSSAKSKDACQALLVPRVARHQGQVGGRPPGQAAGDGSCVQARPPGVRPPVSALKLWGDAAYKATMFHSYDWLNRLSFKLAQEPAADSQIVELRILASPVGRGPHRGRARPPRQRGGQGRQALAHEPRWRGAPAPVPGSLNRSGMRSLRAVRSRSGCSAAKCRTPVVGLRAPRACSWALEKTAAPACARRRRRWWTRPSASASTRGSSPRGRHS